MLCPYWTRAERYHESVGAVAYFTVNSTFAGGCHINFMGEDSICNQRRQPIRRMDQTRPTRPSRHKIVRCLDLSLRIVQLKQKPPRLGGCVWKLMGRASDFSGIIVFAAIG